MTPPTEHCDLVITHASELLTCRGGPKGVTGRDVDIVESIRDGAIAIRGDRIVAVGPTEAVVARFSADRTLDATGRLVTPGLVDPHTHLVHGGSRSHEYGLRIAGTRAEVPPSQSLSSGINSTVAATRCATFDELRRRALSNLDDALAHGTTTLEAKSGYGLDHDTELRTLDVVCQLRHPIDVISTYLALHVLPREFEGRRDEYFDIVRSTLTEARGLAEYCDVSCDPACFTADECEVIAMSAAALGFRLRVHADQTGRAGGAEFAARFHATSADHLDYASEEGMTAMAREGTVAILSPGVAFHLLEHTPGVDGEDAPKPFLPDLVHRMLSAGVTVAIASDYNPGSSPTISMQAAMRLAARLYRLSYAAVWHMATINAAVSLDRGADRGSLEVGKRADVVVWRVPDHETVVHRFGTNLVDCVLKDGRVVQTNDNRSLDV